MLRKKSVFEIAQGYFFMIVACFAYAASTSLFLAPNGIVAGGLSGLSVLIHLFYEKVPVGLMTFLLNIPVMLLAVKFFGWQFVLKSLLTLAVLSGMTDLLAYVPPITEDKILASLYGGVCQGVGIGLFVRYEFSSGGTELLGRMISQWIKGLKIPLCVGILDGIVVISGAIFTKDPNNMLYALIVIFVSTKVSEVILTGLEKSKLCIVITDKGEELSDMLIHSSPRGVTLLEGTGMYTKKQHNVLLTCVKNRQLTELKQIVKKVDENAFIIINESVEVRGKGFRQLEK